MSFFQEAASAKRRQMPEGFKTEADMDKDGWRP
jgi:hypothetical protein